MGPLMLPLTLPPNIFFLWLLLTLARNVRKHKTLGLVYFLHWQDFMRDGWSC